MVCSDCNLQSWTRDCLWPQYVAGRLGSVSTWKPFRFLISRKSWLSLVCFSGRQVRENLPSTRSAVTTPCFCHHRLDWQLHQLQLWGHGTLCSSGKTGARTWIKVQIQVHNHTRVRADPCHHWKRWLCEYGCFLHFQTEKVKFFRTVPKKSELTRGNLLNFIFTYCWRCNYWCSNWSCATVPVALAIILTVFWPDIFTTWACRNRIRTEQGWGSCQELGPWGDNSMHSKGCLMLLGFCR